MHNYLYTMQLDSNHIQNETLTSTNTRRYRISAPVKLKLPSKKMQFIMKYTTLLYIDSSQEQSPNKKCNL